MASSDLSKTAQLLKAAKHVVIVTGAGVSKESGIPTFREAQTGLWAQYDPTELATPQAFRQDPDKVWAWYRFRYHMVAKAEPNPGHFAIVEMASLVPKLTLLTQNIDGLHARAGSQNVIELHGNIARYRCSVSCQGDPTLVDISAVDIYDDHAPDCPHCGEHVRPDVVWFGEVLPALALSAALDAVGKCDLMMVVGTSGVVQPVAPFPDRAKHAGAAIVEVNPEPGLGAHLADVTLKGPAGEILPELIRALQSLRGLH
jgi:NAD-dependent deacetylase